MIEDNRKPAAACTRQQTVHAAAGFTQPLLRDELSGMRRTHTGITRRTDLRQRASAPALLSIA